MLLSLGESLTRAGRGSEANETLRRAAAIAEQHGWSDQLARAALGYGGRLPWVRAATDPVLVPLLERALAAVGADDSHTRVRLLTRLAGALRDDPSRDRRAAIVHEALDIARHSGAPATLACALEGFVSMEGPDTADVGLGAGAELIAVARTALALMEGQFEQAEQLAFATLEVGQWVLPWNAVLSHRIALFVLRREQGRLAEMEDTIARSVHEYPALLRFRCALAHLYAELDREHEARLAPDNVMSCDPGHHHFDSEWLFTMALLPDACAYLAHERAAAELYGLLLPREHLYTDAPAEAVFGSLARGLGVLATTLGQFDDAKQHFDAALETERTMRAGPWRAHAQHDRAAMLLARRGPGDARQARTHLDEALSIYRGLGMTHWAARATALAGTAG